MGGAPNGRWCVDLDSLRCKSDESSSSRSTKTNKGDRGQGPMHPRCISRMQSALLDSVQPPPRGPGVSTARGALRRRGVHTMTPSATTPLNVSRRTSRSARSCGSTTVRLNSEMARAESSVARCPVPATDPLLSQRYAPQRVRARNIWLNNRRCRSHKPGNCGPRVSTANRPIWQSPVPATPPSRSGRPTAKRSNIFRRTRDHLGSTSS